MEISVNEVIESCTSQFKMASKTLDKVVDYFQKIDSQRVGHKK